MFDLRRQPGSANPSTDTQNSKVIIEWIQLSEFVDIEFALSLLDDEGFSFSPSLLILSLLSFEV
jgi:hypothetical protein